MHDTTLRVHNGSMTRTRHRPCQRPVRGKANYVLRVCEATRTVRFLLHPWPCMVLCAPCSLSVPAMHVVVLPRRCNYYFRCRDCTRPASPPNHPLQAQHHRFAGGMLFVVTAEAGEQRIQTLRCVNVPFRGFRFGAVFQNSNYQCEIYSGELDNDTERARIVTSKPAVWLHSALFPA